MLAWAARWPLPGSQRSLSHKQGGDPQKRPPARAAPGTRGGRGLTCVRIPWFVNLG